MNCPTCNRETQPFNKDRTQLIPGILVAALVDGTCQTDYRRAKKWTSTRQQRASELQLENIQGGLRSFLASRRRRGVPAEGLPVVGAP